MEDKLLVQLIRNISFLLNCKFPDVNFIYEAQRSKEYVSDAMFKVSFLCNGTYHFVDFNFPRKMSATTFKMWVDEFVNYTENYIDKIQE